MKEAVRRCGISKPATCHTLRDSSSLAVLKRGRIRPDALQFGGGGSWFLADATVYDTETLEILLGSALLGVGIGFAYSAMANQIVESVPSEQTGVATGMNTIMRTIGGSLGATVSAVLLASSVGAGGLPREQGFTLAFAASALALAAAVFAAFAVPRRA